MTKRIISRKDAEKRLCELSALKNRAVYENLSKGEYLSIFSFIGNAAYYSKNVTLRMAAKEFLYYGTLAFDKFCVPSPFVVTDNDLDNFTSFLDKLWELEGDDSGNAPSRELNLIKWDIYNNFALNSDNTETQADWNAYRIDINNCNVTEYYSDKMEELNNAKAELHLLINGLQNNTITTKIITRLPSLFTENESIVKFKIKESNVEVIIKPKPFQASDTFISSAPGSESIINNNGASRWQNGITIIEITINALFDDSRFSKPLMLSEDYAPNTSWNALYTFIYEIVEKLWFYFRTNSINTSSYIPTPKDIPYISYEVYNGETSIDFKLSQNPSYIFRLKTQSKERIEINDFNFQKKVPWSRKCYEFTLTYMELGQFKEALFWLNVSAESMIWSFAQSMLKKEMFDELVKGSPVFERAEEILTEQRPEMSNIIDWGKDTKVTSIYPLIKRVIKECNLPLRHKVIQKYYSDISEERNKLVHGEEREITANIIQKAILSYNNLKESIRPYLCD